MDIETNNPVVFLAPDPAQVPEKGIGTYIAGGRNVMAHQYKHSDGYPPFSDRAQFIGTLDVVYRLLFHSLCVHIASNFLAGILVKRVPGRKAYKLKGQRKRD